MFLLPGTAPVLLNIKSYTVAQDCIEQICGHLGIYNLLEQNEYTIYYAVESEKKARPLGRHEFICDIISELTKLNYDFYLIFKRNMWFFPLRFENTNNNNNDSYLDMMFNQIVADFNDGLIVQSESTTISSSSLNDKEFNMNIAFLTALLFKAYEKCDPTNR